jgi:hypothetical protein
MMAVMAPGVIAAAGRLRLLAARLAARVVGGISLFQGAAIGDAAEECCQ